MKPGRKPKPTALKLLEGNAGKRELNENEPKFKKGIPECPEVLDEIAVKEWYKIVLELFKAGVITSVDRAALAAYCQLYSRWVQLEEGIREKGLTVNIIKYNKDGIKVSQTPITNPNVVESRLTLQQMRSFCTEFGLTPSSRTRISANPGKDETDPMEELLKNGVQGKAIR